MEKNKREKFWILRLNRFGSYKKKGKRKRRISSNKLNDSTIANRKKILFFFFFPSVPNNEKYKIEKVFNLFGHGNKYVSFMLKMEKIK